MKKVLILFVIIILSSLTTMAQTEESLNINFSQIKTEFDLKYRYKQYNRVLVKEEALKLFDQFINLPSVKEKEWVKSFKKEFKDLPKDGQTVLMMPLLRELKEFPGAKEVVRGKNFRIMELNVAKHFIDYGDYSRPPIVIPSLPWYGISFKIDNKEYVWFTWSHVPTKYLSLYPENEKPY